MQCPACQQLKKAGHCEAGSYYYSWMKDNCCKTCQFDTAWEYLQRLAYPQWQKKRNERDPWLQELVSPEGLAARPSKVQQCLIKAAGEGCKGSDAKLKLICQQSRMKLLMLAGYKLRCSDL